MFSSVFAMGHGRKQTRDVYYSLARPSAHYKTTTFHFFNSFWAPEAILHHMSSSCPRTSSWNVHELCSDETEICEAAVVAVMVWTGMTERPVLSLLQSLLAGGVRSALISPCTVLMLWLRSPPWLYLTCFTPPTGSQRTLCLSCSDRWRLPYDLRL